MRIAISIEHKGSAIIQPKYLMRSDETITPTLPKVSANMCKKTPENKVYTKRFKQALVKNYKKVTFICQSNFLESSGLIMATII